MRTIVVGGRGPSGASRRSQRSGMHLTRLYRGFVGWASLYGDMDDPDERERRERVVLLLDEFSRQYLPRSVWLMEGNRKKIENFIARAEELCSEFSAEIEARGYHRVRRSMEKRVSKKLRPLKTEANPASRPNSRTPPRFSTSASAGQHFSVFSLTSPCRAEHRCPRSRRSRHRSGTTS